MLPYLGVVAVAGSANFILYMPLFLHAYIEIAPILKEMLERKPNTPVFSIGMIKDRIYQGVQHRG